MSSTTIKYDLLTLGETMWRLSPPGKTRLEMVRSLVVEVGGTESNMAIALARLGKRVAWWSRLPDNAPGYHVANTLRQHGVDVSGVNWGGARLGTYYVEFGSPPRPTQVIYDRAGSAASEMSPEHFDWSLLEQTRWLHLTGITPALSESCRATARHAIAQAKQAGVTISFDVNHRGKLWSWDEARPVYDEIAGQADYVISAERDARDFLQDDETRHSELLTMLHERWNGATVVFTRGGDGSAAYDGKAVFEHGTFACEVVDRVGAGDAFDAGLLCELLDGKSLDEALRFGNGMAAIKMTVPGDIAIISRAEVEHLLAEGSSGIIR
jgi:2-dehydro-3-deoxygluconokinase